MPRLIDANDLAKEYQFTEEHTSPLTPWTITDILNILDEAPTVDAVEVVHGWWIELPGMEPDYKCSECGRSYAWWEPSEAHYCPNCGAKMDGDGNDI